MRKYGISLLTLATALLATSGTWAADLPAVDEDGMQLVKDTRNTTVYADPGADLGIYKKVWLQDASVSFKKNWQRDQNRAQPFKVTDKDVERIKTDVATLFRQVFEEQLREGGYQLVDAAGPDVLLIKPAIVNLDVVAPDTNTPARTQQYSESAGQMTLKLELYDSETNDLIVKASDRKEDFRQGYWEYRTRVNNRAVAKRMMTSWAKALREALDEARVTVTG